MIVYELPYNNSGSIKADCKDWPMLLLDWCRLRFTVSVAAVAASTDGDVMSCISYVSSLFKSCKWYIQQMSSYLLHHQHLQINSKQVVP